jgi:hypothetical protein
MTANAPLFIASTGVGMHGDIFGYTLKMSLTH